MKIEHVLFPSVFFKIMDLFIGRSVSMGSHEPIFGTNKNQILKNGCCERALTPGLYWSKVWKDGNFMVSLLSDYSKTTCVQNSR